MATPAFAEVPPCRDIGNPQIGNTCYNELDINARSGPDDASSDHDEMTAGTGWSIIDWNFRNDAQFGSVEGPKYTFTEKGSAYEMKNSINEYTRNLEEVRKKAEAEGNGSKYLADYIDKTLKEYENRRSAVSSAQTNVDVLKVDVTVRGRCLRSTPFGCVDKGGGKLQGVVRVYKRYIGTPEATQTFLTETLSKARELAVSNTQPPCPANNITIRPTSSNLEFRKGMEWNPCSNYKFIFQNDGNLVLYGRNGAIWAAGTNNKADLLVVQADGNVVLYGGGRAVWATNTSGNPGAFLAIQSDGNLVVYGRNQNVLWSTGTRGR